MIAKAFVSGLLCACYVGATAQALSLSEVEVDQMFKNLRGSQQVMLRMTGVEYLASGNTPFATDLFYSRPLASAAQDLKMEMIEARGGLNLRRVVADGRHVWGVDLVKNTYSASRYGSYTAVRPTDYEQNVFQSLNVQSGSQSAFLSRMVREVWGGTDAQYRPWIPNSSIRSEMTIQGGASLPDPVVITRNYISTPAKIFHVYWLTKGGVPSRSVTFELDDPGSGVLKLSSIYYSDRTSTRLIDWKMDVLGLPFPYPANFVYSPPAGAKAIAGPRPNGGG